MNDEEREEERQQRKGKDEGKDERRRGGNGAKERGERGDCFIHPSEDQYLPQTLISVNNNDER